MPSHRSPQPPKSNGYALTYSWPIVHSQGLIPAASLELCPGTRPLGMRVKARLSASCSHSAFHSPALAPVLHSWA